MQNLITIQPAGLITLHYFRDEKGQLEVRVVENGDEGREETDL